MPDQPKILTLDVETSPIIAHVWALWDQTVGLNQIVEPTRVLCFAAKWAHEKRITFSSEWELGHEDMLSAAYNLLDEADIVVHFNGAKFDIPHLNREFDHEKWTPPSPFRQVDLYQTARRVFYLPSNKLEYVTDYCGLGRKMRTGGHELWKGVLAGDPACQARMRRYNIQDVRITEQLYYRWLPWIRAHPSFAAYTQLDVCPACGSDNLQRRGYAYTAQSRFQQFVCLDCGKWTRATSREDGVKKVGTVL